MTVPDPAPVVVPDPIKPPDAPDTEVTSLGYGGQWLVGGTTDTNAARDAVAAHLIAEGIASDEDNAHTMLAHVITLARVDWFWQDDTDGDPTLCVEQTGGPWGSSTRHEREHKIIGERSAAFEGVFIA